MSRRRRFRETAGQDFMAPDEGQMEDTPGASGADDPVEQALDLISQAIEAGDEDRHSACCSSHAKVVALAFASGERLSIEGSANLCGNGSGREQFALIADAGLHDWHAGWIDALVTKHEGDADA